MSILLFGGVVLRLKATDQGPLAVYNPVAYRPTLDHTHFVECGYCLRPCVRPSDTRQASHGGDQRVRPSHSVVLRDMGLYRELHVGGR